MAFAVVVRQLAEQDIVEAQRWYEEQRANLGSEFGEAVDELLNRLGDSPLIYPAVYQGIHRAVLRRFPYLVYFAVAGDVVTVLTCLHSSRDPLILRSRAR